MRNQLRRLRLEAGLTQRQLAKLAQVPDSTLARLDHTPSAAISLDIAARIANALHVDPLELLPPRESHVSVFAHS